MKRVRQCKPGPSESTTNPPWRSRSGRATGRRREDRPAHHTIQLGRPRSGNGVTDFDLLWHHDCRLPCEDTQRVRELPHSARWEPTKGVMSLPYPMGRNASKCMCGPFQVTARRLTVSSNGGTQPRRSSLGREYCCPREGESKNRGHVTKDGFSDACHNGIKLPQVALGSVCEGAAVPRNYWTQSLPRSTSTFVETPVWYRGQRDKGIGGAASFKAPYRQRPRFRLSAPLPS